ncbi:hypothetical protein AAC387_Pa04g1049 [Persea americana]
MERWVWNGVVGWNLQLSDDEDIERWRDEKRGLDLGKITKKKGGFDDEYMDLGGNEGEERKEEMAFGDGETSFGAFVGRDGSIERERGQRLASGREKRKKGGREIVEGGSFLGYFHTR